MNYLLVTVVMAVQPGQQFLRRMHETKVPSSDDSSGGKERDMHLVEQAHLVVAVRWPFCTFQKG